MRSLFLLVFSFASFETRSCLAHLHDHHPPVKQWEQEGDTFVLTMKPNWSKFSYMCACTCGCMYMTLSVL